MEPGLLSSDLLITVPLGVERRSAVSLVRPQNRLCLMSINRVDLLTAINSGHRLLLAAIGISWASTTWLYLGGLGLAVEPPSKLVAEMPENSEATPEKTTIFVNPTVADDSGDGSSDAPFKTITQALEVAPPNSIITLAPGTYSTATGEQFPLKLKPRIAIAGDPQSLGSEVIIKGGGTFLSPTFARQNITILGASQASLSGVTVTNPNSRGYGVWIESSDPIVTNNTFTGNSHDGISITGNSAPIVRGNHFRLNGANGMTIYGKSRPEVRDNLFEKTGFGINIAQTAAPILIGNRIFENRSGIVTQANAQPVLRSNLIENNQEDGVVAIANSQPNLGTKAEPGGNVFRQNGRYDINSSASKQIVPAFGNQLAHARTNGGVDLAGAVKLAAPPAPSPTNSRLALRSTQQPVEVQSPVSASSPAPTEIQIPVPPPASVAVAPAAPSDSAKKLSLTRPIPPANRPSQVSAASSNPPITSEATETAIEIPVPSVASPATVPAPQADSLTQGLPILKPDTSLTALPVPSPDVPIGNNRQQSQPQPEAAATDNPPPQPPTKAAALGLRYRVVVEAATASKQEKVRTAIPGAFRTFSNGKVLMQLGAFSDRTKADEMLQMAKGKGLTAKIEQLD